MDETAVTALLAAAMPGCAPELARRLMLDVTDTLGLSGDPADAEDDAAKAAAALQTMAAAAPRDPLEAMLAAQMAACHGAAMRAMKRAAECSEYPQIEALYGRQAARLMRLFMRQMEALARRRAVAEREAEVETGARPIAVRAGRVNGAKRPRPPNRPAARCNGAAAPRNGRRHRINETGPPS